MDPKQVEDVFSPTPLQEGMLFHYLQDPASDVYFEQLSVEIGIFSKKPGMRWCKPTKCCGRCTGIILNEFFQYYDDLSKGKPLSITVKKRFKEFVRWIGGQDAVGQEQFWRNYFEGFDEPTLISIKRKVRDDSTAGTGKHPLTLDSGTAAGPESLARQSRMLVGALAKWVGDLVSPG